MSTDLSTLFNAFIDHRDRGAPLVLATIVGTAGSTYRKAGARMLLEETGGNVGILGGGCFEGDLAEHAARVLAEGTAQVVEYDMRGNDDLIWGLGLGCNGLVRILLQPLVQESAYQPFDYLQSTTERHGGCVLASVVCAPATVDVGASLAVDDRGALGLGLNADAWPDVVAECESRRDGRSGCRTHETRFGAIEVFYGVLRPVPHLLLLGGGPDAVPVAEFASKLCWRVTVADHRPAWVTPERFPHRCEVLQVDPTEVAAQVDLASVCAAVVMSHSFAADEGYLHSLVARPPAYVGLLGPAARRDALLDSLSPEERDRLRDRVRGPAGLDLGGRAPQAIALSLIAEIQAALTCREAQPMDERYRQAMDRRAIG